MLQLLGKAVPIGQRSRRTRYRSKRSVQRGPDVPNHLVTKWTKAKVVMVTIGAMLLATITILPIVILEQSTSDPDNFKAPVSLHNLISKSVEMEHEYEAKGLSLLKKAGNALHVHLPDGPINVLGGEEIDLPAKSQRQPPTHLSKSSPDNDPPAPRKHGMEKNDLNPAAAQKQPSQQQLGRGVSGLPISQTPALVGAERGHVDCDVDVDDLVYWNDPQGTRDENFASPFATPSNSEQEYFLTFEPDPGGWNNIRMSMEIIFVLAVATGRTLVLPPKAPFYLLGIGKQNARSFGSFFPLDHPKFAQRVKVITMPEFLEREGRSLLNLSDDDLTALQPVAEMCLHKPTSEISCENLYPHLRQIGHQPPLQAQFHDCLVFDLDYFQGKDATEDVKRRVQRFCGERTVHYYDKTLHEPRLIHWDASKDAHRLLNHFYAFLFFTDPAVDNFFKRFVRDFLHYKDQIYCAAGKIVHALNVGGKEWSSMHIRRGDFQYKNVKLPAEEWYENTKEVWKPGEIIFIATDERNKTFFDPIRRHHELRFLDDYWDVAKLGELDKNFLGMIDTIVASHGRAFAGTWFSTFTGYINRMRGYLGHSMKNSWYSFLKRKDAMQEWKYPEPNYPAREWPVGWVGIDGDKVLEHENNEFPAVESEVKSNIAEALTDGKKSIPTSISDLRLDGEFRGKSIIRGIAGRPTSETPGLVGAARGHIDCDVNVDSLAYWNDPQGNRDRAFVSPFAAKGDEKYITFTIDRGGWNNVRMSMEIIFVVAAATGRTLVLPPKEPFYRLRADTKHLHRGFADFFPLHTDEFQKRVKIISTEEFVHREGGPDGRVQIPDEIRENVMNSAAICDKRKNSTRSCNFLADYLAGAGYVPDARAQDYCVVFDQDVYEGRQMSESHNSSVSQFCGERHRMYWTQQVQDHPLVHFRAGDKKWRLLTHFYGFIHFTDPLIDNFYKRFVRDFLHYHDSIFCAAGKIVKALQVEGAKRGFVQDSEGAGGFSAMHVRRGEFQKVKLPASEWYENTKELWQPKEILYIATDERNKTFFDPIAQHHDLRFLDDYFDLAALGDLDPNYFGMIDTIVSSRARAFAGTWFSTFTGYINRMRGYHGMSMQDTWYSFLEKKIKAHEWVDVDTFVYAYEWPTGWIGIDADVPPSKDRF